MGALATQGAMYGWKEHVNDTDVACCTSSERDPRSVAMQKGNTGRKYMRSSACMTQNRTSPLMVVRMSIRYNKPWLIADKVNSTYDQGKNRESKIAYPILRPWLSGISPGIDVCTPWANR